MTDAFHDPGDGLLRALRPNRSDAYLRPGEDPVADALLKSITTTVPTRRRWRWRRLTVFLTGTSIVVGAGVTTAVLRSRSPEDPTTIECHSGVVDGQGVIEAVLPDPDRNAIERCAELWTNGTFGLGDAPELAACVTHSGVVAVLPGAESICAQHGWDVANLEVDSNADPATELQILLSDRFSQGCFNRTQASEAVQEIFDELGLRDWKIDSSRAVDGCNTVAPEPLAKTVAIVDYP